MEIVAIYPDWLYSIQFDEEDLNEYHRVFREWHDLDYLVDFFATHKAALQTPFWQDAGILPDQPEKSAKRVTEEADQLEAYIQTLVSNCQQGTTPDLDQYFRLLGGKYKYLWTMEPVKSYGTRQPSLLRLYAIRLEANCYLIVYGGIKLGSTIQNSPVLRDQVFHKIDAVLNYLKANGIVDSDDL